MANFKRKRPKTWTTRDCGYKHCRQDEMHAPTMNGRERYLPSHWKKFGGIHPWRYIHKNV